MGKTKTRKFFIFILFLTIAGLVLVYLFPEKTIGVEEDEGSLSVDGWYLEAAKALESGKPLVFTQYVALCDNVHQGIVPVPGKLGDGDNPDTNLYWGAAYGYRTFFKKHPRWTLVHSINKPDEKISQIFVFSQTITPSSKWKGLGVTKPFKAYLVVIGYRGRYIKDSMEAYLNALFGEKDFPIKLSDGEIVHSGGQSHYVGYTGHNYFMDLPDGGTKMLRASKRLQTKAKATMILACKSRVYFVPQIRTSKNCIIVVTQGLMAPEAYTAAAVYESLLAGSGQKTILNSTAKAYAKYQKISIGSARRLFTSGQ